MFRPSDGQGGFALDWQQLYDRLDGTGVISGGEKQNSAINIATDVEAVQALVGKEFVSSNGKTVDFTGDVNDSLPRKAIIYINEFGEIKKELGEPEPAQPEDKIRFETESPAPPTPPEPGAVLHEVWIGTNTGFIDTTDDVRDRRVSAVADLREISVDSLDVADSLTVFGNQITGGIASTEDIPEQQDFIDTINNHLDHGTQAPHEYFTSDEARQAVRGIVNAASLSSGSANSGEVLTSDGDGVSSWEPLPGYKSLAEQVTVSGDGQTTTFSLPHTLGETPNVAAVIPTSSPASTDFYISAKTDSEVEITYAAAPPSGTDNLTYDIFLGPIMTEDAENAADTGRRAGPDVKVYNKNSIIYAAGKSGTIATGDISTPSDVLRVIQSGIDAAPTGGHVFLSGDHTPASTDDNTIHLDGGKKLTGNGTINWSGNQNPAITVEGIAGDSSSIVSNVPENAESVVVSNTAISRFTEDEYAVLTSTSPWSSTDTSNTGEIKRITDVDTDNNLVFFDEPISNQYTTADDSLLIPVASESGSVSGLTIQGDSQTQSATGIHFDYAVESAVEEVDISNCGSAGIVIERSHTVSVNDAIIGGSMDDTAGNGIYVIGPSTDVSVRNNTIRDSSNCVYSESGSTGQVGSLVVNSNFVNGEGTGATIRIGQGAQEVEVSDNTVRATGIGAVAILSGAKYSEIESNRVHARGFSKTNAYSVGSIGTVPDSTLVGTGNWFIDCGGFDLSRAGPGSTDEDVGYDSFESVTIKSNVCTGDSGELVRYKPENADATVRSLYVNGNVVRVDGSYANDGSHPGISIENVLSASIASNDVSDIPAHGIVLIESDSCHIVGNNLTDIGRTENSNGDDYGIWIDNVTSTIVSDNKITDTARENDDVEVGINETGNNSDNNRIYDNFIENSEASIDTVASSTIVQEKPYNDTDARSAVTGSVDAADLTAASGNVDEVLTATSNGTQWSPIDIGIGVATTGSVTLSGDTAIITTGVADPQAEIGVLLGPGGNGETVALTARARWNESRGEHEVEVFQDGTTATDPSVSYLILTPT